MKTGSKAAAKAGTKTKPSATKSSAIKSSTMKSSAMKSAALKSSDDGLAGVPARVPIGTTFVLEGKPGKHGPKVFSRYLQFPDGTRINLMERAQVGVPVPRRARRSSPVKTARGESAARSVGKRIVS